jgi:hypothetical protein
VWGKGNTYIMADDMIFKLVELDELEVDCGSSKLEDWRQD